MNQAHTHLLRFQWQSQKHISSTHFLLGSPVPLTFHEAPQASSGNSEKVGNQGRSLLRRHADHGKLQRGSSNPPSNSNASLDTSGVYPQPWQECSNTHSEGDFLGGSAWIHIPCWSPYQLPGFSPYNAWSERPYPEDRQPFLSYRTAGLNGIHSSSSFSSPTALPPLGESEDNGTKTQSQLQHCSNNLRQHEAGSNLVAPRTPHADKTAGRCK